MLRHRNIDRICCIVLALTLLITCAYMGATATGMVTADTAIGYENRLFDQSYVHTIDIVMDDWDAFLDTCTSEEYSACTMVIDGESYGSVAIRGKGNTSLSSVQQYGNDRYSFKVEFDHYQSGASYHGLDKLSLNNIIQDNTYLKDYTAYTLMSRMGVDAPLCSFAQIRVNGEVWGLYLAVEGVEDSFLQRNYGADHGELYKPDSMSFGGGRGNGRDFDIEALMEQFNSNGNGEMADAQFAMPQFGNFAMSDMASGGMPAGEVEVQQPEGSIPEETPNGRTQQRNGAGTMPEGFDPAQMGGFDRNQMPQGMTEVPDPTQQEPGNAGDAETRNRGGFGGFGGMGSDDVKLKYIDDDPASYPNIFDNAKTDVSETDQARLIESLKQLSEGNLSVVDQEAVLRYLAVHNFLCNGDSYTGSIVHNYYLYEEDGVMAMIPWDYNLAFGGHDGGSNATSTVNAAIDTVVTSGDASDRPMVGWVVESEDSLARYHEIYAEFMDNVFNNGWFEAEMQRVMDMIAPYVQNDPSAFCSYEDFQTGSAALLKFCRLRAQSVNSQLSGSDELVDASGLNINDMGSMGFGGGNMRGGFERGAGRTGVQSAPDSNEVPDTDIGSVPKDAPEDAGSFGGSQGGGTAMVPSEQTGAGDIAFNGISAPDAAAMQDDMDSSGSSQGSASATHEPAQQPNETPAAGVSEEGKVRENGRQTGFTDAAVQNRFPVNAAQNQSAAQNNTMLVVCILAFAAGLIFVMAFKVYR